MLPSLLGGGDRLRVFSVVAESPAGEHRQVRLTADSYRGVIAATSFKQRTRKMLEYYHADRASYAVVGTPNRLEYDQGFFVKNGDGAADVKPIAHLYKTQVYQLAEHLDVPETVRSRPPTTDTYSLPQSQEEFYFSVPYETMDLCLYALNNALPPTSRSLMPLLCRSMRLSVSSATSRRSGARRPTFRCRRGSSNLCRRSRPAEPKVQSSRRPVRARPRVTSSAYSRSEPTGRPLASRVTRTLARRRSAM